MTPGIPTDGSRLTPSDVGMGRLFYLIQEAVVVADTSQDRILLWNGSAERMFGYTTDEALSMPLSTLVPPNLREQHREGIRRFNEVGAGPLIQSGVPAELPALRKDGTEIFVELSLTPLGNDESPSPLVLGIIRDVTDRRDEFVDITSRREAERALRDSEERFRQAFDNAPIGVALVGLDGHHLKVNRRLCELVGYSERELLAKNFRDITHPDDVEADLSNKQRLLDGEAEAYEMEKRYVHSDGSSVRTLLSVSLVRGQDGVPIHFIAQSQDITDRKVLEEELLHQASHDPLTGVWNRRRFEEEVSRQLLEAERYDSDGAVLFIDLDRFKDVNDEFGHQAGDEALKKVAEVLKRRFRRSDSIGRLGGDEFAVLLQRVRPEQAEGIANLLSISIASDPLEVGGHSITLSASIGVAPYDRHATSLSEVMMRADRSMYERKRRFKPGLEEDPGSV